MPARRAVNVCVPCHRRKVRCDIDANNGTCTKCIELGETCSLRKRKEYSARRPGNRVAATLSASIEGVPTPISDGSSYNEQARLVAAVVARPTSTMRPLFIGSGGYGDLLRGAPIDGNRHFLVPAEAEKSLRAEDLAYLEVKGCLTLPSESKSLLRAYFLYVHPSFPIVNGSSICRDCTDGRLDRINLLLLWSMFSVAASYVPDIARHTVKQTFVERATLLFHLTPEGDKLILVQSALLLSFWFAEAEDVKQSWYWTGIAFSIAQSLGLHRDFSGPSLEEQSLRHDLWRACMIRDVWLSFGMGRPLRLQSADCNLPLRPISDCSLCNIVLFDDEMELYSEAQREQLFHHWQRLNQLSDSLRTIITTGSPSSPSLNSTIEAPLDDTDVDESRIISTVSRHFRLHQCAAKITYYHRRNEEDRANEAAEETCSILQSFLSDDSIRYVAPVVVPLIVPAILNYLGRGEHRQQRSLRSVKEGIRVHLQFLKAIEENYPAATILSKLVSATKDGLP